MLTAPSQKVVARGERIEYNLQANSLALDGGQEVFLQQGPNEIHARSLYYESSRRRAGAFGPRGGPRARLAPRPEPTITPISSWKPCGKTSCAWYPDERNQVISLTGGAELNFPGMGQLQAREIFLWLLEGPPGGKTQAPPRPDRMWARHDVHVNSPQLFGTVEDLQVWFDDPGASQGPAAAGNPMLGGLASAGLPVARPIGLTMPSPAGPMAPAGAAAPAPPQTAAASQPPALQRFKVVGRLFQARVALGGPQITVSRLKIEDNVQFLQTQTARPGDRPIMICGDSLEATSVNSPQGLVTVTGQPARFDGGPLAMTGLNINLDQAANRVWIDGPGQMQVPLPPRPARPTAGHADDRLAAQDVVRRTERAFRARGGRPYGAAGDAHGNHDCPTGPAHPFFGPRGAGGDSGRDNQLSGRRGWRAAGEPHGRPRTINSNAAIWG